MEKDFRLESILNLREHILDSEREKLINLNNIKDELLDRRANLNNTIEVNVNELEIYKRKGRFEFITIYENYIYNLNLKIEEIDKYIRKLNIEIDKQMKVVMEARKDKKIMEKLKEKHKDHYEDLQRYLEGKFIDEVNTVKYNEKNH
jgi:flagellar FliJ protein